VGGREEYSLFCSPQPRAASSNNSSSCRLSQSGQKEKKPSQQETERTSKEQKGGLDREEKLQFRSYATTAARTAAEDMNAAAALAENSQKQLTIQQQRIHQQQLQQLQLHKLPQQQTGCTSYRTTAVAAASSEDITAVADVGDWNSSLCKSSYSNNSSFARTQ
jgi:hypothetical protein